MQKIAYDNFYSGILSGEGYKKKFGVDITIFLLR